jgi:hypothetical protein
MAHRRPLSALCLALLLGLAAASCGGATDVDDDGGTGGTGASGGASGGKGGTSGSGGKSSTGGTGNGTGAAGGTGAVGGTGAGATGGGTSPSLCALPAETGPCEAYFPRFFHNAETGFCESFVYGGCEGNENNFETLEECTATCGSKALDACEDNGDCLLRAKGCCGACEPSDLTDFVALNSEYDEWYAKAQNCEAVDCAPCLEPEFGASNRPYFVATCEAGRCVAVDLRATEVTACTQPSECSLRFGSSCCEGCGGNDVIAVSDEAALSELVCPAVLPPCPACLPGDPDGLTADCQKGRCVIAELSPTP